MSQPQFRRMIADIETSPNKGYFWNAGYDQNVPYTHITHERAVICIAWKWEDDNLTHVLHWERPWHDKQLLKNFLYHLEKADEVVFHNGARFDLPWLRSRFLKNKLPPFPDVKLVDTLRLAWGKYRFNSNKLDYLAKFLGIPGKHTTGFALWERVIEGDSEALKQMEEYCKNDVVMLEKVYKRLAPDSKPATHQGVFAGKPAWTCPHCASDKVRKSKTRVTPSGALQHQMRCMKCESYFTLSNAAFKKYPVKS